VQPDRYDAVPDLARLLRVLHWSRPPGIPYPGSADDLRDRLLRGLGLPDDATAASFEHSLRARTAP
jgi:hypothetical protein